MQISGERTNYLCWIPMVQGTLRSHVVHRIEHLLHFDLGENQREESCHLRRVIAIRSQRSNTDGVYLSVQRLLFDIIPAESLQFDQLFEYVVEFLIDRLIDTCALPIQRCLLLSQPLLQSIE